MVSRRKKLPWFDKDVQRAIIKSNSEFKKSTKHSKCFPEFKMARKVVSRPVAIKKCHYYNNKVMRIISRKSNIFRVINEITSKRVESKSISLRSKDGAAVDDGETVDDLFNKYFTTNAGKNWNNLKRLGGNAVFHQP